MSLTERVSWGLLAGAAIVLVKIIGPDREYVHALFTPSALSSDVAFYAFISAITVLLGTISGVFSNERDRVKLLLFCASVPALLSTATGQLREPTTMPGVADSQAGASPSLSFIITSAYAQTGDNLNVCDEGSFLQQFSQSAKSYLGGSGSQDYAVIVSSTKNLDEAKGTTNSLAASPSHWNATVGCRRPGNDYYPVMIGNGMTQVDAARMIGKFVEANPGSEAPYLDNYPYRKVIYTPSS